MNVYPRPEFLYDFKLKKVFINYNTEAGSPSLLFAMFGGEVRNNPYNNNSGYMLCGIKDEPPQLLISRVLDDFKKYSEKKI